MDKEAAVHSLTDTMAKFTAYIGKRLPKDVKAKLAELRTLETNPLAKSVYDSMAGNHLLLGDIVYYRRLNEQSLLPVDFPVYVGASIEAGNVWLDESDVSMSDLEYAGSVFLGIDSPLGPIYLGVGASEDDEQAVYLQIGQVFD